MNKIIFYDGPSQLTGEPIVGVLSGMTSQSHNPKIGDMLQAWILLRDVAPTAAIRSGHDEAICGQCSLRGNGVYGRGCYVTFWQGPERIWKGLTSLPRLNPAAFYLFTRGCRIRLGAYGDPAAIPVETWQDLIRDADGAIGYTQQWRTCDDAYRGFLMASCLSSVDYEEAKAKGWRTYRVRGPLDPVLSDECICPASNEANHKLTCSECMLCTGADNHRANPTIIAHGKPGNLIAFGLKSPKNERRPASTSEAIEDELSHAVKSDSRLTIRRVSVNHIGWGALPIRGFALSLLGRVHKRT